MHVLNVDAEVVFQALSDATRIRIMRLLSLNQDEACLCELAESLDEPEYKLSRHLKILRQSGLIEAEKDGRWIYHRLVKGNSHLKLLYSYLKQIPDYETRFKQDNERFEKRKSHRVGGRCKTESAMSPFKKKAK